MCKLVFEIAEHKLNVISTDAYDVKPVMADKITILSGKLCLV